ncbi:MAG TPA: tRNA (adenosine(37)-N6)-dimethylallyltransferase MiaA, partial [Aquaticitalea sp.]|nr:tRNA (adenosine(37)-N6)-dimethylallyltransferase MiaA [Aquaticitalea sp.]
DFERDAIALLHNLFEEKNVVVMAGGSGLYVDAVLNGMDDFPDIDPKIRETLNLQLHSEGIESLQQQLELLDPETFAKIDTANPRRIIRALEVCIATGKSYASFLKKQSQKRNFSSIIIGITAERSIIYDRINRRVDLMMAQGLLEEVRSLKAHKTLNALNTVGYKELFKYLDGEQSLEFAVSEIKKNTRRFAKRQLTWFRKKTDIIWVENVTDFGKITHIIDSLLNR